MNETEIRQLLAAAMAYDNRKPGQANIAAWREAAHRARWTFDAALDAIHAHYAESTDFLMPGHITTRIRNATPQHPPPHLALPRAQPADETTRDRIMAIVGGRFGPRTKKNPRASRDSAALAVQCPWCDAAPNVPCAVKVALGQHRGENRAMSGYHPSRVEQAQKATS